MLTRFWEGVGTKLTDQWLARVFTPAFAFWAGGLAAWVWGHLRDDIRMTGWSAALRHPAQALEAFPPVIQGALVAGTLLALVASSVLAERLTLPLLRLLEGYWPAGRPRWLRVRLVRRWARRRERGSQAFSELYGRRLRGGLTPKEYSELRALEGARRDAAVPGKPPPLTRLLGTLLGAAATAEPAGSPAERRRDELRRRQNGQSLPSTEAWQLARIERTLRRLPQVLEATMPTRLGNVLRAAEERPRRKYGLDTVAVWPQFWLVLPKDPKEELIRARVALDAATRVWLWGVLFAVWTIWAWWALPVALAAATLAYYGSMLGLAETYGDLVEAAFDVHRLELYRATRWPMPTGPSEEQGAGAALTEYLWRGTTKP